MNRPLAMLLAAALAGSGSLHAAENDPVLFELDGQPHRASGLSARLGLALFEIEFEHHHRRRQLVEDAVFEAYAAQQAAAAGRALEETVADLLATEPASEEQLRAVYEANRQRINAPYEQVRERIAQFVAMQQRQAKKREIVAALAAEGRFAPAHAEPQPPRVQIDIEGHPARGAAEPAVTVVEFADYQCPYCKVAGQVLDRLLEAHAERLRVVYIDFPINPSGISRRVALGAECARRQDRYWDYHQLAFARQRQLDADAPLSLAAALALEPERFRECLEDPATARTIARAEAQALSLGLDSTPTLFLDGRRLILQDIENELPAVVEAALETAEGG